MRSRAAMGTGIVGFPDRVRFRHGAGQPANRAEGMFTRRAVRPMPPAPELLGRKTGEIRRLLPPTGEESFRRSASRLR